MVISTFKNVRAVKILVVLFCFSFLAAASASGGIKVSKESYVPPGQLAPDETRVYVIREGRFYGGGSKVGILVNDTVKAVLRNKTFSYFSVKRGKNNVVTSVLSTPNQQFPVDDRAGETVYLLCWISKSGVSIEEIDERKANKFIKKYQYVTIERQTRKSKINYESYGAALSMRRAEGLLAPTGDKALVRFIRRDLPPSDPIGIDLMDGDKAIGNIQNNIVFDYLADPGKHLFISNSLFHLIHPFFMEAELEAGKTYYVLMDPKGLFKVRGVFIPVKKGSTSWGEVKKLEKTLIRWAPDQGILKRWEEANKSYLQDLNTNYEKGWKTKYAWPRILPETEGKGRPGQLYFGPHQEGTAH